jgi:hypothetical protein
MKDELYHDHQLDKKQYKNREKCRGQWQVVHLVIHDRAVSVTIAFRATQLAKHLMSGAG